jgi:hypothetical protein
MATVTDFIRGVANQPLKHLGGHKIVQENVLDFSEFNVSAADIVQALPIQQNAILTHVRVEVITAEGGVVTLDIGDTDTDDGWDAAVDGNAAAGIIGGNGVFAANGKRYSAEGRTIDIVPSADLDTAVVYIAAEYWCREVPQV